VTAGLACAIADGSEVISDFRVLADQKELFGPVASVPGGFLAGPASPARQVCRQHGRRRTGGRAELRTGGQAAIRAWSMP
jgi:hypothetical protein